MPHHTPPHTSPPPHAPVHSGGHAALYRVPILSDNYTWILANASSGNVAVIDPGDGKAVVEFCRQAGLTPSQVINTHHHDDHIGGNAVVCGEFAIPLTAPVSETSRIPDITHGVGASDEVEIAGFRARVFATPGHTRGQVAFYLDDCFWAAGLGFVGDALFRLGCGRVNEGTMGEMWESLLKIRGLADDTLICAGHEYSLGNAKYAASLGWDNAVLAQQIAEIETKRQQGEATLPFWLGVEKRANPFLNCDDAGLAEALGMAGQDAVAVFSKLRKGKDEFKG